MRIATHTVMQHPGSTSALRAPPDPARLLRGLGSLATFLVVAYLPSATGAWFRPDAWYAALAKPAWTPPDAVFARVWLALYATIGVAGWLAWRGSRGSERRRACTLYALQLALNAAWPPMFFGAHWPNGALAVLSALWVAALATTVAFAHIRRAAGAL